MKTKIEALKRFLEEERKDCLELKKKNFLTLEGEGMLMMVDLVFDKMGWDKKE